MVSEAKGVNGELFIGYRVSILQESKFWRLLNNNVGMDLRLLNCILKNGQDDKFMLL